MVFPDLCIWNCVQTEELSDPQEQTITSRTYIVMCLKLLANSPFNCIPPVLLHHGSCFLPEGQSLNVEVAQYFQNGLEKRLQLITCDTGSYCFVRPISLQIHNGCV